MATTSLPSDLAQVRSVPDILPSNVPASVSFTDSHFRYDPYPIGVFRNFLPVHFYERLVNAWPETSRFVFKQHLGDKYSLSEVNNRAGYLDFIRCHPEWQSLYEFVKAPRFTHDVLNALCNNFIDLGLSGRHVSSVHQFSSSFTKIRASMQKVQRFVMNRRENSLSTRFEFSMLPSAGGHIKPHTDAPQKLITLVISMLREGEWNETWGGGTDVLRPKEASRNFNHLNKQYEFEDMEWLETFAFHPNQCVVFIKTFNSFHAVNPMTGPNDGTMRKTLTVNIESWG